MTRIDSVDYSNINFTKLHHLNCLFIVITMLLLLFFSHLKISHEEETFLHF